MEVAIKMAFQYWQYKGYKNKTNYVALQHGYHGDTVGAISVGGIDIFHSVFKPLLFKTFLLLHLTVTGVHMVKIKPNVCLNV